MNRTQILFMLIAVVILLAFGLMVVRAEQSQLSPGTFTVYTCAETGAMPIIDWTRKGMIDNYELRRVADCTLTAEWTLHGPGLYCTGIGDLDGAAYAPEQCINVTTVYLPVIYQEVR